MRRTDRGWLTDGLGSDVHRRRGANPPGPPSPQTPLLPFQRLRLTAKKLLRRLRHREDLRLNLFCPLSAETIRGPKKMGVPAKPPPPFLQTPPLSFRPPPFLQTPPFPSDPPPFLQTPPLSFRPPPPSSTSLGLGWVGPGPHACGGLQACASLPLRRWSQIRCCPVLRPSGPGQPPWTPP